MTLLHKARRLAPVALLLLAGCGDAEDRISLVPVKGKVTRNGEPLANASVMFMPSPGNPDQTPGGDTSGPAGTYLARFRTRSGLAPGKYKVIITPGPDIPDVEVDAVAQEAFKDDPIMLAEMKRSMVGSRSVKKGAKKAATFKLEAEAEVTDGSQPLDFDVKTSAVGPTAAR